jgi:polyisoprenoid-binding protein YceI
MRLFKFSLSMVAALALTLGAINFAKGSSPYAENGLIGANEALATETIVVSTAADTYAIDAAHSTIGFSVRHLVINNIPGRFKEYTGTINYDTADITKSSVQFTAKVASIDTGIQQRDDHLRTADFFEVAKHPEMTFKSSRIEKKGKDSFIAHGTFTLKGISKEIAIPFKVYGPITDPYKKTRMGVEANLVINRQDYGVTYSRTLEGGGLVISNDVNIHLNLEAVKQ